MGLIQPLKTQEVMVKALALESPCEKVCKILSVEGKPSGICKWKRPYTHLLHKQWTDLWTHIAKWWHGGD